MVSITCNVCFLTEYIDPSSVNQPGARPVGFNLSNASCKMLERIVTSCCQKRIMVNHLAH